MRKSCRLLIESTELSAPGHPAAIGRRRHQFGSPPTSSAPPPSGESDYAGNLQPPDPPADFDLPDFLKN